MQIQRQFAEICRLTKKKKVGLLLHTKTTRDFLRALLLRSYNRKTSWFRVAPIKILGVSIIHVFYDAHIFVSPRGAVLSHKIEHGAKRMRYADGGGMNATWEEVEMRTKMKK